MQRLCGNLQVDISKARSLLGWVPPVSVEQGLRRALIAKAQCIYALEGVFTCKKE